VIDDRVRPVLDRLYSEDKRQREANLPVEQRTRNLTPESGKFLMLFATAMGATGVVEVGSSNGVSTIWLAAAMRETGGAVTGTELLPERAAEANANLAEAGLAAFGRVIAIDAADVASCVTAPIDLAFIDAEKEDYVAHFERVFPLVRRYGVIVADNVVSHDLSDYQRMLRTRSDCESVTLPLDRGLEITIRIG
jgi:predicted O-methyltransferase YrrM